MKNLFALVAVCAVSALGFPTAMAADAKPAAPPGKEKKADAAKPAKPRAIPYKGELKAIDPLAKTVTIGERVFQITSETKLTTAGKPATLADLKAGDAVTGQYREANGKLEAVSVYAGKAPAKKPAEAKPTEKKPAEKK